MSTYYYKLALKKCLTLWKNIGGYVFCTSEASEELLISSY